MALLKPSIACRLLAVVLGNALVGKPRGQLLGDADTTAAIAGQIAGALYGERSIPADWRAALLQSGTIGTRAVERLAMATATDPGSEEEAVCAAIRHGHA